MLYGFSYGMASASVRRSTLAKSCSCSEIQLQRQLHKCIQQTMFVSIPHQQNLVAHALNIDHLAASKGICTTRLGLLLFEN